MIAGILGLQGPELIVLIGMGIILGLFVVLPFWFIFKKAGLSPGLSFIGLIPFGPLILLFMLAFMKWPAVEDRDN